MRPRNQASSEADYDEILKKLDALLHKHQGMPSARAEAGDAAVAPAPSSFTAPDNIPMLTEIVLLPPTMLSPQADITSLLEQIVDSALRDAGADLATEARAALVQALECRLFGL
ncbi:MAG: hypothetical protein H0U72_00480 [Nitrosospira sp.]|nr:hypothetical protein [Nitrosospira sp.]